MSSKTMSRSTTSMLTIPAEVDQVDQYSVAKWRLWNKEKIISLLPFCNSFPK
jgi:hypothetical protein